MEPCKKIISKKAQSKSQTEKNIEAADVWNMFAYVDPVG
jgi:hypothetical protein